MQAEQSIPSVILDAYFDVQPRTVRELNSGVINQTYAVTDHRGDTFILQQLNTIFSEQTVQDFMVVSKHLANAGWPVQHVMPTRQGKKTVYDTSGGLWRLLSYIEGEDAPETMSEEQLFQVGAMLAKLHNDLQQLDYTPQFVLSNFHNTQFYTTSLRSVRDDLPTQPLRKLADDCLHAIKMIDHLPTISKQLIHGDPRTTNIIFDNNLPIAYIDFDTLMFGSPWIDIGDILRSINGSNDQTTEKFSINNTLALARGYYSQNTCGISFDEFFRGALVSMQIICIELAMRFVTDIVCDSYFGWDPNHFKSRRENNIARAEAQWDIYKAVSSVTASQENALA